MNTESVTTVATTAVHLTDLDAPNYLEVALEDEAGPSLDVTLSYDPADPVAVTMVIETVAGPVPWTFARDLLVEGYYEPTGDGDIHVWPCLDSDGAAVVIVELESPEGGALLQLPARPVDEFIAASLASVPRGAEQVDVDAWIEQVFARADA